MGWKLLCISLILINFLSFFWSVIGVFSKKEGVLKTKYRILQFTTLLTWVVNLYISITANVGNLNYIIESLILTISLTIFWKHAYIVKRNSFSIVYTNDKPIKLIQEGLYKYIRHPFYSAYILCYLSIAISFFSISSFIMALIMLFIYRDAALFEENKFFDSSLNDEYVQYRKKTGMFFPKIQYLSKLN